MKKTVITIAITAVLTAVLMIIGYFIYTKIINKDNNTNINMTEKNENNYKNLENQISKNIKDINLEEWRKVISVFYEEHYGYKPDNVTCTEVFPRVGIEYENDNTKFTIPLMISGMDGKFTFTDYKNLVKDISIY